MSARLLLLAIVMVPSAAHAQSAGGGRHRVALAIARASVDERDESVSPLRYRGSGLGLGVDYALESTRWRFGTAVNVRTAGLERVRNTAFGGAVDAEHTTLDLTIDVARQARRFAGERGRLYAGVALDAYATFRDQEFGTQESRNFGHVVLTLAPAARVELDRREATSVAYGVAVPLVTGMIRSYSDNHQFADADSRGVEWASLGSRRIVRQNLAWTSALGRRVGFRAAYAVELFDLRGDADTPRLAGQRSQLSASLIWWTRRSS